MEIAIPMSFKVKISQSGVSDTVFITRICGESGVGPVSDDDGM